MASEFTVNFVQFDIFIGLRTQVAVKCRTYNFVNFFRLGLIAEWQNRNGFGRISEDNLLVGIITIFDKRKLGAAPA